MTEYLKYKSWYADANEKLKNKYKGDLLLICGLIASISPQMAVERNIFVAELIYQDFKTDKSNFLKLLNNKTRFFKKYGLFKPHYNNIVKTIYHDFKIELKLNGNKVYNFYKNLSGDFEAITIDTHMLRYFKHDETRINHLKKSEYIRYSNIIKSQAREHGLLPAEFQAVIWIKTRQEQGLEPVSFSEFLD
jgi:thermostable 8-oxoguanine DNA glycosylase